MMPLFPTTAAASLLRGFTNPPLPQKIHSAAAPNNLRDSDDSSSVTRHRSASDFSRDPPSPTPAIELKPLPPRPKPSPPSSPRRPRIGSTDSTDSTSSSTSSTPQQASHQQRRKLSEQIWREYW